MPSNRLGSRQSSMTRCGKCCYYCRQVATFLFSHIGLCTLLLGYALVGAFTFQVLESDNEHQLRKDVIKIRANMITELSNMTNHSQILMRENWTKDARLILEEFEKKFVNAVKIKGFDGSEELNNTSSQWTFSGALLYSIIVITTIGYGNVAPRTDMGKVVTILYAIIGIPLMLFCLSNIGHAMAHSFKFIYWKCCCFLCVKPKKVRRRERRRRRLIRQHRQRAMMQHSLGHSSSFNDHQYNQHQQMAALYGAASLPQTPITAPVTSKPETKEANGKESGNNHRSGLGRSFSVRSTHFRFPSFHHKENSNKESAKQTNLNNQSPTSAINTSATTTTAITTTTNSTTNSTTTTPENNSMQTTPLSGSDCSNCTPKFFPSQPAQSAPSASSHEYCSLDPAVQSTATATSAITTPTTTITNFTTNSLVPKKSNLSRSHSARRYNETFPVYSSHYQQPHQLATFPNGDMIMARNPKDKASLHSIICNKYASLSDECIDASREFQEPTIHLRLPPKRVQSQVRFRPSQDTPNLNLVDESQTDDVAQPPPFPFPDTTQGGKPESALYIAETKIDQAHAHHQLPPPPFHQSYYHPNEPVFESESQLKQMGPLPYYQKQFLSKDELMDSSYAESENGDDDDDDDDDIADKNIPITVCLALVIGYICGGAWFFSNSEEWSFLDASYFCFITLSTIGFGDLVPGRTVLSTPEDGQMTLAICALYLLFGMALLAMMLNLVKEKAIETVRIVGQRIGILVSDEDNYY